MSNEDWEFPAELQPKPESLHYDLDRALSAVVAVRAEVPDDAFTASILGTERDGNGVIIREDGLILTIGYLVTEAETIWMTTVKGTVAKGHVLAYDQTTGLGLIQALGRLGSPHLEIGNSASAKVGDQAVFAGAGGRRRALRCKIMSKREFAGYWEYVLDEAIFTAPAHPHWGGAGVIGDDGRLLGIGSLLIQEVASEGSSPVQGNMVVPIDLLPPILDDLLRLGRPNRPPRPWLGMYTADTNEGPVVAGLTRNGPAHRARVQVGDRVVRVAGESVGGLADMLRKVWALGPAGTDVPLTLARSDAIVPVRVRSANRDDFLKKPMLQ
ncbi:MAG TPA: S1C family serine protease [Candidatus Cybelea sp.]|nr:S1C family serine protease [Candidatus Cybelea sp.]